MPKTEKSASHRLPIEESHEWCKILGRLILSPTTRKNKIIVPSRDEMIGIYALERDDQLPPRPKPKEKS